MSEDTKPYGTGMTAAQRLALAMKFHDKYEELSPLYGYATREDTRTFDPDSPNGQLIQAVCGQVVEPILAELAAEKAAREMAEKERDDANASLYDIKDLLPDEAPCRHDETGVSLYDDIRDMINERDGLKGTYNQVFGALYSAGFHDGTVPDKVRAALSQVAALRSALEVELKRCPVCAGKRTVLHGTLDGKGRTEECQRCKAISDALSSTPPPVVPQAKYERLRELAEGMAGALQTSSDWLGDNSDAGTPKWAFEQVNDAIAAYQAFKKEKP